MRKLNPKVRAKEFVLARIKLRVERWFATWPTWALKVYCYVHLAVFLGLEFLGLIPGLSHVFDLVTLVVLDEILQGIMVAPALKELTRRDEAEKEELTLLKGVRDEVEKWVAVYCAKLIGEGRVAELPEKVAIPLESIVPIRGEINELQRRVLESVSSLVVRTGEWAIANIEIDRTARTVYLVVRPTEAVRDRLEAGRRSVPLR